MSTHPTPASGRANRLVSATSPYLRQHARNPVDWWPWCEEALALARAEDRPILLSIGYSACHWCHVMAHESFEDAETAELMNRLFISMIRIDQAGLVPVRHGHLGPSNDEVDVNNAT